MAVVKVFDKNGVKTLEMMGNANEQAYDVPYEEIDDADPVETESAD